MRRRKAGVDAADAYKHKHLYAIFGENAAGGDGDDGADGGDDAPATKKQKLIVDVVRCKTEN